jgi:hypothetical protein
MDQECGDMDLNSIKSQNVQDPHGVHTRTYKIKIHIFLFETVSDMMNT